MSSRRKKKADSDSQSIGEAAAKVVEALNDVTNPNLENLRAIANRKRIKYSDKIAEELLERLAAGDTLGHICREPHMPTPRLVMQWRAQKPEFEKGYLEAMTCREEIRDDECYEIARDEPNLERAQTRIAEIRNRAESSRPRVIYHITNRAEANHYHLHSAALNGNGKVIDHQDPLSGAIEDFTRRMADEAATRRIEHKQEPVKPAIEATKVNGRQRDPSTTH